MQKRGTNNHVSFSNLVTYNFVLPVLLGRRHIPDCLFMGVTMINFSELEIGAYFTQSKAEGRKISNEQAIRISDGVTVTVHPNVKVKLLKRKTKESQNHV